MIMYLDIDPKSPQLERLQKMQKQCKDIQYAVENEFYETQREKAREITEKVQQFVDEWRSAIAEASLSQRDKAVYNTLLGAAFNQLPSYNELSTHFLTQAVRYDQSSAAAYYELGVSLQKAGTRRRAELSYAQALRCAPAGAAVKVLIKQSGLLLADGTPASVLQATSKAREAHSAAPNSAEACVAVAQALLAELRLGLAWPGWELQLSKAACMLRKAVEVRKLLQQRAPAARFSLGVVERLRLNLQAAHENFSRAYAEDPGFVLARDAAQELVALAAFLRGGLKQRAVELCSIQKPEAGLLGLVAGKNKEHPLRLKLLHRHRAAGQPFFVAQGLVSSAGAEPRRCAFTPGPIAGALKDGAEALKEGAVVELSHCVTRQLVLHAAGVDFSCWCVCADAEGGHLALRINDRDYTFEVRPEAIG